VPGTLWLLFYSASRNAKTFAGDTANIPLVQLNILIPVSLHNKADPDVKLIKVYQAPKQQGLSSQSPALHQPKKDIRVFRDGSLFIDTD